MHEIINRRAAELLPGPAGEVWRPLAPALGMHASDADHRKSSVAGERTRHFIDIDAWGEHPFDDVPRSFEELARRRARVVLTSGGLEPVEDDASGDHSAFAIAFLDVLSHNEEILDTSTLFARIRRPVMLASDQTPELADIRRAGHEGGDFLFVPVP